MTKQERDAYGDAIYDAWRAGLNSDHVDPDRVADDVRQGFDRFEAAEREVDRLYKRRRVSREED